MQHRNYVQKNYGSTEDGAQVGTKLSDAEVPSLRQSCSSCARIRAVAVLMCSVMGRDYQLRCETANMLCNADLRFGHIWQTGRQRGDAVGNLGAV